MQPADPADSVKTSPLADVAGFLARMEEAGRRHGFRIERFGDAAGLPLLAFTKRTRGPRPRLYLSAGIHGDEPAGPLALLTLLERGEFDERAGWFLCPVLHPTGFLQGTRENSEGLDLNRDYKMPRSREIQAHTDWLSRQPNFDVAICLHEDWESTGFYLYELNSHGAPSLAPALLAAAAQHCPIESAAIIDGRPVDEPGVIRPLADPALRDLWPESIYLHARHACLSYTLESPSTRPLPLRVATLAAAVTAAVCARVSIAR